jgi:hypothetical protein
MIAAMSVRTACIALCCLLALSSAASAECE